jgi:acyl-coenzyme A synthetase/AMP-(fatty) acid ligase
MMWPYMLAGLACGARIILYEGSPFYPDVREYLKFIDEQKYTPVLSKNALVHVRLTALARLVRVPASSQRFRVAAFSLAVRTFASVCIV